MERLTYKFNSLSLANFAANTIKKDGVGVVLSNNNGFIVVETADAASVQEIANSARGYEVLREATKKKLTPDQLKKVHTGVAAQMQAKKGAKKEEIEEEEEEESEEFFEDGDNINEAKPLIGGQKKLDVNKNGKLDAHDFKALRAKKEEVEVNENTGLMTNLHHPKGKAVLNKSGKIVAIYKTERAARKHASTGKPVKEEVEQVKEGMERISTPNREFHPASKKSQARWKDEDTRKSGETWKTANGNFGGKNQHNQVSYFKDETKAKAWASGKTKYQKIPYFKDDPYVDESINTEVEQVDEAKPLVGGQKKLDVNKNGKLDAHDFKALRAKKEEVERIAEVMNPQEKAKQDAINARIRKLNTDIAVDQIKEILRSYTHDKKQREMIIAAIKQIKEEVEVNEAAPAIKAGMRLYAKQDKKTDNGSVVKGQYYKVADAGNGLFNLIHQSTGYRKAMIKVAASAIQAMIQNKVF